MDFYKQKRHQEDEKTKNTIASLQAVPSSFRASPSHAHFDLPPFLRTAKQARGTIERGAELYSPCKEAYGKLKEAVMGGQCLVFIRYHKARVMGIGPYRLSYDGTVRYGTVLAMTPALSVNDVQRHAL